MLRQPHTWKLPRMYTTKKHYPPISKWTLTWTPIQAHRERSPPSFRTIRTPTIESNGTPIHKERSPPSFRTIRTLTIEGNGTPTQGKKPTFFQDHQNSNRLMTQKLRSSTQVRQPRQEYSRFTETEKAKFQTPFIYNDDRNFVGHNSVEKFSTHLVYLTKLDTFSDSIF